MKKFKVCNHLHMIRELEVLKETAKQVTYIERGQEFRERKISEYTSWHDTKEKAVLYMASLEQSKIDNALRMIKVWEENINKIYSLI